MLKLEKILAGTLAVTLGAWISLDIAVTSATITYANIARHHYLNANKAYSLKLKREQQNSTDQFKNNIIPAVQTNADPDYYFEQAQEQIRLGDVYSEKGEKCWQFVEKYGLSPNISRLAKKIF